MKNIRIFYLKIFILVKFSLYLNRRVFIMTDKRAFHIQSWEKTYIKSMKPLLFDIFVRSKMRAIPGTSLYHIY